MTYYGGRFPEGFLKYVTVNKHKQNYAFSSQNFLKVKQSINQTMKMILCSPIIFNDLDFFLSKCKIKNLPPGTMLSEKNIKF